MTNGTQSKNYSTRGEETIKKILREVLAEIKPEEEDRKHAMALFNRIAGFIRENYGLDADLMGSVAKDTFLKGDVDLDIFVFFPLSTPREVLEEKALEIGRKVFEEFNGKDVKIAYAEHPYVKGVIKGLEVEIVPAYRIKSADQLKSAVDRTPFHKEYVLAHLKNPDDVRILKAFLKAMGAYGSDLKTAGFSGYLCELLIIHYGSFVALLRACQKWRWQEIIDPAEHYTGRDYPVLRKMFKEHPLIVIDPVDKNRNVAAALSAEKLAIFIYAARKFLERPSKSFFKEIKLKINKKSIISGIKKDERNVYAIVFKKPENIVDDTLYPQLRKFAENMASFLEHNDFVVEDWWVFGDDEAGIAFEVVSDELPFTRIIKGPRIFDNRVHQDRFVSKHEIVWIGDGGRFYAREKRKHRNVGELVSYHLNGSFEEMRVKGIPKYIALAISEHGYKLLKNEKLVEIKSREFWKGLTKFNLRDFEKL